MSQQADILLSNGVSTDTFYPARRLGNTSHLYAITGTGPILERETLTLTSGQSAQTKVRRFEAKLEMPYTYVDSNGDTQTAYVGARVTMYIPDTADTGKTELMRQRMLSVIADGQTIPLDIITNDAFPY